MDEPFTWQIAFRYLLGVGCEEQSFQRLMSIPVCHLLVGCPVHFWFDMNGTASKQFTYEDAHESFEALFFTANPKKVSGCCLPIEGSSVALLSVTRCSGTMIVAEA